jgi:phage gp29-like protein
MISTTRFYLENINPLRGLDLEGLVSLIESGERGYYARLQWLFYMIEKRDPMVRAVKRRLISSLASLKWDIKIEEEVDESDPAKLKLAQDQAATLKEAYRKISNLQAALNFLALAELRGFSHLEKVYKTPGDEAAPDAWDVVELRVVEQWFWTRSGRYSPWQYNRYAQETNVGEAIDPRHYIIRTIDDPADEVFAELVVKRKVSDADWDGFLEDYGIPPLFITLPPNVPKEREAEYQRAAELAVSAARGSLPNGAQLTTPSAGGSGGAGVFKERLEYLDGQIVVAGTSGKLTVLAESGSGTLAGGAQKEAFDEIAQAIADQISSTMQEQFDKAILESAYPDQPILAYFEFSAVDEANIAKHADNAVKFGQAGYAIDDAFLTEKTGYPVRYVGAQAAHTNRPDGTRPIGVSAEPGSGEEKSSSSTPAAPKTEAPKSTPTPAAAATETPVNRVAASVGVAPQFLAPGKSIIDNLLARAADDSISVDELTAAAEDLLKTLPELAEQTDLGSVIDALQAEMQKAAEATLAGSDAE